MISSKHLAEAIYKIANDKSLSKSGVVNAVFDYVKSYKLEALLPKVINHLEDRADKESAWDTLDIESGLPIDESTITEIKKRLHTSDAKHTDTKVNSDLIGGFVATYKGQIYDASIKNQLQLLKKSLTK